MTGAPRETFDPEVYMSITYDDLVTYALSSLINRGRSPTFENLVEETFLLFPSRFHLIGHPEWPDSALINKSWLRCRSDKNYITGSVAGGFRLTPVGARVAEGIGNRLGRPTEGGPRVSRKTGDTRTKAGRIMKYIEKSNAFRLFKTGNKDQIGSLDFYEIIFCTPESLPQTKLENFQEVRQYATDYNRDDMVELLNFCF